MAKLAAATAVAIAFVLGMLLSPVRPMKAQSQSYEYKVATASAGLLTVEGQLNRIMNEQAGQGWRTIEVAQMLGWP